MSIAAVTDFANPDPSIPFTTVGALVNLLRSLVSTVLPEDLTPYVTGSATPAVDDQDKIWMKLDGSGRPLGIFKYYSGTWRRFYSGLIGETKLFVGNPATYFDANGRGWIGLDWDGWHLLNGLDGYANHSDRFPVGAHMSNTDYAGYASGVWRTNLLGTPLNQGGIPTNTLTADTTYRPATAAIQAGHFSADGNAPDSSGGLYGSPANSASAPFDLVPADAGKPTPDAFTNVPPFTAVALAVFVGYTYTNV